MNVWTPQKIERLRELWPDPRLTTEDIGRELGGLTKGAVLGKAHRLDLGYKPSNHPNMRYGRPPKARTPRPQKPKFNFGSVWGPSPKAESDAFVPRAADIVSLQKTILELREGDCRWPEGDGPFTFCGHPAVRDKSYCASHCQIGFMRERRRAPNKGATRQSPRATNMTEWMAEEMA